MRISSRRMENGQSLALLLLLMFGFFVILALVIDGGNTYFQRRNAQNAADAGALAGARVYCETLDEASAKAQAKSFVNSNEAKVFPNDLASDVTISGNKVTVDTEINYSTFIGNVIGRGNIDAVAHAAAGCYSPTLAEGVLPIIWFCKPSVTGEGEEEDDKCIEQFIDWETLEGYLPNPTTAYDELYIVMDNYKYDETVLPCIEDDPDLGWLDCDWDEDGKKDSLTGGRGWTDLDGDDNNGANAGCPPNGDGPGELEDWIINGYTCELDTHTWTPKTTFAVADSVFQDIECRVNQSACGVGQVSKGPLVLLPVYDDYCPSGTPNPTTPVDCFPPDPPEIKWHNGIDSINYNNPAADPYYFHIVHFAPFYITCVQGPDRSWTPTGSQSSCPGYDQWRSDNPTEIKNSTKSVEGYFLWGYVPGLKGRGDDDFLSNVFTVYLDE